MLYLNMRCKICQNEFVPNKHRPKQQICSRPECQKQRQTENERQWRLKNPDYFKSLGQEAFWRQRRAQYSRIWKKRHKKHLKEYAEKRKKERQEYMRNYMAKYRLARNVNREKS